MNVVVNTIKCNEYNTYLDIISNNIRDMYCNVLHLVSLKVKTGLECEIEIIGENIYIRKNIDKLNNDYIYCIVNNIQTPLFIKIIINDVIHNTKRIYIGDYTFSMIEYEIHDTVNIENIITKIPIVQEDIPSAEEEESEDEDHTDNDEEEYEDHTDNDTEEQSHEEEFDTMKKQVIYEDLDGLYNIDTANIA